MVDLSFLVSFTKGSEEKMKRYINIYLSVAPGVFEKMEQKNTETLALAELDFTLKNEMVHTAMDFFSRRTGRIYFDIQRIRDLQETVLATLKAYFDWDEERFASEKAEVERTVFEASNFPPRHETENVPSL